LLSSDGSCSVIIFTLLTLLICFSILRRYIRKDDQDLAIWGLELFSWIVREIVVWATWNARLSGDDYWFNRRRWAQ
jgi:hypothetical protein